MIKKIVIIALLGLISAVGLFIITMRIMADKTRKPAAAHSAINNRFRNGDLIFQASRSSQSKAIQLATHSKYSHMGIIYETEGQFYVYEAVQPVKLTKLSDWISRGENSHYVVKRLKEAERLLTTDNLKKMRQFGEKFRGKNYDVYFEWSDDRIYCSELVWKIYKEALGIEIGTLQQLREFDLKNDIVKNKMKERYGDKIPLDENVISPSSMFESDKLIKVIEN